VVREDDRKGRAMTKPASYVTRAGLVRKFDTAYRTIGGWVGKQLKPLEARIAALEARPELKHRGIWRENKSYQEASLVTHAGSLWLCKRKTKARPGQSPHWQLIVKSGSAT
jgi:hypothetical protein